MVRDMVSFYEMVLSASEFSRFRKLRNWPFLGIHDVDEHPRDAHNIMVVVSNIFYVHPCLGKIPNLTNIFQRG